MAKSFYVVTMENDEMNPMEIGYASNSKIAERMIKKASSTDGFENNTYHSYETKMDVMEINGERICFEDVLSEPLSMKQMVLMTTEDNTYIEGNVLFDFFEFHMFGSEEFLDFLSEKLTASPLLMDISFKAVDVTDSGDLILHISGDVSNILEIDDDMVEELKKSIFDAGADAVEDFLGHKLLTTYDIIESEMDDVIDQMPDEELIRFYRKYVISSNK